MGFYGVLWGWLFGLTGKFQHGGSSMVFFELLQRDRSVAVRGPSQPTDPSATFDPANSTPESGHSGWA